MANKKYNTTKRRTSYRVDLDPEYFKLRAKVLKRDSFTCQMPKCPGKCKKLQMHHIIRWADCPRLRYEEMNCITLCKTCHKKVTNKEKIYAVLFSKIVKEKYKK